MQTKEYMIRAQKIVTVSELGTIMDGAIIVKDGKIKTIGKWKDLAQKNTHLPVKDFSKYVVTPALVDCHTHLLEFAPSALYPITVETEALARKAVLLNALSSGITAIGEQICGHPYSSLSIEDYRKIVSNLPIDCSFAATSISIGFEKLAHYSSVTGNQLLTLEALKNVRLIEALAKHSDYPGENLFINATPANFTENEVPRAGETMYTFAELKRIVKIFHANGKQIGVHVAGEADIEMAIRANVDVLHHAHQITTVQMKAVQASGIKIVATPLGGTHLEPNSPDNIVRLVQAGIEVAIATDAYLPAYPHVSWLPFKAGTLQGSDALMKIAAPSMRRLKKIGFSDDDVLRLITANPAAILNKQHRFGKLVPQMDANFLIAKGIPGIDIDDVSEIKAVYFQGKQVIDRNE